MPSLLPTVRLWLAVQTQWRVGWDVIGLDYTALNLAAQWLRIEITPEVFRHIQLMEGIVLKARREVSKT